jgi:hypothetical protein
MVYQRGDILQVTCKGRTVEATVLLASPNDVSLMLGFEAILEGHVGMMPVLLGEDGTYRSIANNVEVEIGPK